MVVAEPLAAAITGTGHSQISSGLSYTRISVPLALAFRASAVPGWFSAATPRTAPVSAAAAVTTRAPLSFTTWPALTAVL